MVPRRALQQPVLGIIPWRTRVRGSRDPGRCGLSEELAE